MRFIATVASLMVLASEPALAVCQVSSQAVQFGTINQLQETESTGKVIVTCDEATGFDVAISVSASGTTRQMLGPNNARLDYFLYSKPDRTTLWADGSSAGETVSGSSDGSAAVDITVYGLIPQQSNLVAGNYNDSLSLLLTF